jgi:hypothetical protein
LASYDAANGRAVLIPDHKFRRGVIYRATVTTETRDFADSDLAEAKVWVSQ